MHSRKQLPALPLILVASLAAACSPEEAEPEAQPAAEETRAPLELAGQYRAFLYGPDHEASTGGRHTEAWQVLREDRLNYHARNIRQEDDADDPIFDDAANRERIEMMVANGNLTEQSARRIVEGNVLVAVDIYTRDDEPTRLDVSVY